MMEAVLIGMGLGMAGSLHCVGMCGPLALSLPLSHTGRIGRVVSILLYNLGRTATYFLLGTLLGLLGHRMVITAYQQLFAVITGVIILIVLIAGRYLPDVKLLNGFRLWLKRALARFLSRKNKPATFFMIGMLNGLLPCGMVYMAVASALLIGGPLQSGVFMAAFGMGTLPLMGLLMLTGHHVSFSLRNKMRKLPSYFMAVAAVLIILRGLNLGIPFISPAYPHAAAAQAISCPVTFK
ncbi:hypothetical protein A8C56_10315 [Niabella ginsenosidivorans]|uniref:Urease accessory protein UreH-like transmembrane domain-containing protein n=1 Tax=Niabella ginsenosidivorans TaxID=1176587 RepID=A0A1A9I1W9_9BACT|nr:sulfite exporter TauE/SafE family protein [Niabella ginsenosidivorans]ANH81325.1 hypothetical protein A8C56_10315 [Niabella ginsenosidivorans]